jgi:DNA-directed RNA polymerase II subunit RPB2
MLIIKIMDFLNIYFNDHKYPLTSHQLDSYREFLRTNIPNIIKSGNPITMIKTENQDINDSDTDSDVDNDTLFNNFKIEVTIGYNDNIYIDRPILNYKDKDKLLTPNDAKLKNLTYQTNIYADIKFDFFDQNNLNEPIKFENKDNIRKDVYIGSIPIMTHSDACILHGQNKEILKELKECINDYGGYFIIDGKEKVIVSQEQITKNRLFLKKLHDDDYFSHKAYISCKAEKGEGSLISKRFEMLMYKKNITFDLHSGKKIDLSKFSKPGSIVFNMAKINLNIPIILLFKFLGVANDLDIYTIIFGDINNHSNEERNKYSDFLRPSFIEANKLITNYETNNNQPFNLVKYIVKFNQKTKLLKEDIIKGILYIDLFPNIISKDEFNNDLQTIDGKLKYLGYLLKKFADFTFGFLHETDKDSYFYKRIDVSGFMLSELFNEVYDKFRKQLRDRIDKLYYYGVWRNKKNIGNNVETYKSFLGNNDDVRKLIPSLFLSETFIKSLKGKWGLADTDDYEEGKVQDLSRISYLGYLSHVRRVDISIDRDLKIFKSHMLHPQQYGIICPYETPDGGSIGYLKNLALLTKITSGTPEIDIYNALEDTNLFINIENCSSIIINQITTTKILLNGSLIGITFSPLKLHSFLKLCKRTGCLNILISVSLDYFNNELIILTEPGRPMRPLHVVKNFKINNSINKKNWFDFLIGNFLQDINNENIYTKIGYISPFAPDDNIDNVIKNMENKAGTIEYIDVEEADKSYIAMFEHDITKQHTHCEIHPSTILSVVSANIPLCNHSFAARNIFHAAQSKQAIGLYTTNFNERFDTMSYLLHYPQKPIISTQISYLTGSEFMYNGTNIIVAVMAYSGFNQEDSLMINKGAINRGFEEITYYKSVFLSTKTNNSKDKMFFCNPLKLIQEGKKIINFKNNANYKLLNDNGFIAKGTYVPPGKDTAVIGCILQRTVLKEIKRGTFTKLITEEEYIDKSFITDDNYYGLIDKVYISNKSISDTDMVCKVRFLKVRQPELGDKHSSRHGQKGVIGRIFDEEDMPYTKDGLKPDIIMNSHAFPSRMTIGHIVESVFAKLCCLKGNIGDGTVFIDFDKNKMQDQLLTYNFDKNGNEVLYNGYNGKQINADIFIGPVYYFRLKHMVADKINARGRINFPKQPLTRQPTAGRRKHGGLRIGEMERDSILAHGVSKFIQESYMQRSDDFTLTIDKHTGTPVNSLILDPVNIKIPYCFKLLYQELETMGLGLHYVIDKNNIDQNEIEYIDNFSSDDDNIIFGGSDQQSYQNSDSEDEEVEEKEKVELEQEQEQEQEEQQQQEDEEKEKVELEQEQEQEQEEQQQQEDEEKEKVELEQEQEQEQGVEEQKEGIEEEVEQKEGSENEGGENEIDDSELFTVNIKI